MSIAAEYYSSVIKTYLTFCIQAASMKSHCLDLLAGMAEVSAVEQASSVTVSDVTNTRSNAPW